MLLLSDMPFIKLEACTKVNLHCTMPLLPITKMVELLLLSHDHVCTITCIQTIGMTRKCKARLCVGILEKSGCKNRFIGGDHDKTSRLG